MKRMKKLSVILLVALITVMLFPAAASAAVQPQIPPPAPNMQSPQEFLKGGVTTTFADAIVPIELEGKIVWYEEYSGGNILSSDTEVTEKLYYAAAREGNAESSMRTPVMFMAVDEITMTPIMTSPQQKPYGSTVADLDIPNRQIVWYEDSNSSSRLVADTPLTTGTYYAAQCVGSGESINRVAVVVTIVPSVSVEPSGTDIHQRTASLVLTFDKEINIAQGGTVTMSPNKIAGTPVYTDSGMWSSNNTILTIPLDTLEYNTTYTISVSGFKDTADNTMAELSGHTFTTAAENLPDDDRTTLDELFASLPPKEICSIDYNQYIGESFGEDFMIALGAIYGEIRPFYYSNTEIYTDGSSIGWKEPIPYALSPGVDLAIKGVEDENAITLSYNWALENAALLGAMKNDTPEKVADAFDSLNFRIEYQFDDRIVVLVGKDGVMSWRDAFASGGVGYEAHDEYGVALLHGFQFVLLDKAGSPHVIETVLDGRNIKVLVVPDGTEDGVIKDPVFPTMGREVLNGGGTTGTSSPQTGDPNNMFAYIALIALIGIAVTVAIRKVRAQ